MESMIPIFGTGFVLFTTGIYLYIRNLWKDLACQPTGNFCDQSDEKEGFSTRSLPLGDIDTIVIGSGMSGLTVASLLAKENKKVLVLEQHDVAGGNTHTFEEAGFEFDTGLHYIGGHIGSKKSPIRKQFDYITDGNVDWERMDDGYDLAKLNLTSELGMSSKVKQFYAHANWKQETIPTLHKLFPNETQKIDEFFTTVRMVRSLFPLFGAFRMAPPCVTSIVLWATKHVLPKSLEVITKTTKEVFSAMKMSTDLKGVLSYCFGDYGEIPSRGSFFLTAIIWDHYKGGAYYPIGGPSVIARSIIPIARRSGGKVLVRAPVSKILLDSKNQAIGVEVKGKKIYAANVVSTIGAPLTYTKMVPDTHKHLIANEVRALKQPILKSMVSLTSLFVGFDGTAEELKLPKHNYWVFPSWDHELNWKKFEQDSSNMPAVFISFSSVKDPTYKTRYPGKQVALVIAPSKFSDVSQYCDSRVKHRGLKYDELKSKMQASLLDTLYESFPQIKGRVRYTSIGTAVSNDYYLGTHEGAIFGLGHTPARFMQPWLRAQSPIKNLYLSGQDVVTCGIVGALTSGFLTVSSMSTRTAIKLAPLHI